MRDARRYCAHCTLRGEAGIQTTLADVAEAAGMYPSHLLYYFNGKEAISNTIFGRRRKTSRTSSFRQESPESQTNCWPTCFAGGIKKTEIGFMLSAGVAKTTACCTKRKAVLDHSARNISANCSSSRRDGS
jgi:hypothetical protein